MPRLLIHFARFGPYHHARLRAAAEALKPYGWEIVGLETAGTDTTYAWDQTKGVGTGPRIITAFPGRAHEQITARECHRTMPSLLNPLLPDAIAIAGWGSPDARACLDWCSENGAKAIVMSETREADGQRIWWKEFLKSRIIRRFDAALVGGKSHRDYLIKLGMPADRIHFGYNVVDNAYFAAESNHWKNEENRRWSQRAADQESGCSFFPSQLSTLKPQLSTFHSRPYFLACNRFIERKNLARLINAYASYAQKSKIKNPQSSIVNPSTSIWPLCLLGDGELKATLIAQCHGLGLNVIESAPWESAFSSDPSASHSHPAPLGTSGRAAAVTPYPPPSSDLRPLTSDSPASHSHPAPLGTSGPAQRTSPTVYFPGFRQIDELPRFYAHAGCFVHPALEEPWGLVINEAMACGLPVLSGSNVGAAEELVDDGVNGWTFDAEDVEHVTECLRKIAGLSDEQRLAMGAASARILEERCPTAAFGRGLAEILKG